MLFVFLYKWCWFFMMQLKSNINMKNKSRRSVIFILSIMVTSILLGPLVSGAQPLLEQPNIKKGFRLGETLEYTVKVRGIPAGSQIMQIVDKRMVGGREVYHLEAKSQANKFFSLFYQFEDQFESYVLKDKMYPIRFTRNIIDGGYRGNLSIDIDDGKRTAKIVKNNKRREMNVPKGVQDELSMLYFVRTKDIEVGKDYEFPAIMGTKIYNVDLVVLRTEYINTIFGKTKTFVIKSVVGDVIFWVTQDDNRILVKLETGTKLGKLVAELKSIS
jgi:hypothetical protein